MDYLGILNKEQKELLKNLNELETNKKTKGSFFDRFKK